MQQDLDLDDVLTLEGTIETDDVNYFVTLQRAINSGLWQLQGNVGRTMMARSRAVVACLAKPLTRMPTGTRYRPEPMSGRVLPAVTSLWCRHADSSGPNA